MKKFISVILSIFLLGILVSGAYASEKDISQKKQVANYEVELITANPLISGETAVKVVITKDGSPAQGAPVKIVAVMDKSDNSMKMDMENVAPIEKSLTESSPGTYLTDVIFDGDGRWKVDIIFDNNQSAVFEVTVIQKGPNWLVVGGFLGIILLVVGVFAFGRGKKKSCG